MTNHTASLIAAMLTSIGWPLGIAQLSAQAPTLPDEATSSLPPDGIADVTVPRPDLPSLAQEDEARAIDGMPYRFAVPDVVDIRINNSGTLEHLDASTMRWRLRIRAPGASSLSLGFERYRMPEGGRLTLYSADGSLACRPFTDVDNAPGGQLWTPPIRVEEMVIEVSLAESRLSDLDLTLTRINYGYRGFGRSLADSTVDTELTCEVDVACPVANGWLKEIPAVGLNVVGNETFGTGCMLNNTANDLTPLYLTARHNGITASNAASLVVIWNFQKSLCGGPHDGVFTDFTSGATVLATYEPTDFTLLKLAHNPNPAYGVTFAGWNRNGLDSTGSVGIHHPIGTSTTGDTAEKRFCLDVDSTSTTTYYNAASPGDGTHLRVGNWEVGLVEVGSSGSPLFNSAHQVIGQLHGGDPPVPDCITGVTAWYGKLAVSWEGGGTPASRLKDWLDPGSTGAVSTDTLSGMTEVAKFSPPVPVNQDHFGNSVAISNDTLVIGSLAPPPLGGAFVFVRNGTAWNPQAVLSAPDTTASINFGIAVALDHDTLVVGASTDSPAAGAGAGSAYVFSRHGTTWVFESKLTASDGMPNDAFGTAVAVSGKTIVAGAPSDDHGGTVDAGSAYLFQKTGAGWAEQTRLSAPIGGQFEYFSTSVSIDGDTVLVGANPSAFGDLLKQAAYVFTRSGSAWSVQATLNKTGSSQGQAFGSSVSLSGDTAVVGAYGDGGSTGSAYVFVRNAILWSQQAKLSSPIANTNIFFGYEVALSGDTMVISSGGGLAALFKAGAAFTFVRVGSTWSEQDKLLPSDSATADGFGGSVAISGHQAVVGAPALFAGGAAYVFDADPSALLAPWSDLGNALSSTADLPTLKGEGTLLAGDPVDLSLTGAPASAPTTLVVGLTAINKSFKGGVMVPDTDILLSGLATDSLGNLLISVGVPSGIPSGTTIYLQHWIQDPAGPKGFAASNAVAGTTP